MIWTIIPLFFLYRAILSYKDENRDKTCALAYLTFCIVWTLSRMSTGLIEKYAPYNLGLLKFALTSFLVLFSGCLIFAVYAFIKHDSNKFSKGKSQAGWAMGLSALFAFGMIASFSLLDRELGSYESFEDKPLSFIFEENNYTISLPAKTKYNSLDKFKSLNDSADFILMSTDGFFHLIISEKIGIQSDDPLETYSQNIIDRLLEGEKNGKLVSQEKTVVDGIPADDIYVKIDEFLYNVKAFKNNGILYQLTTYCDNEFSIERMKSESRYLSNAFRIIDRNKIFNSESIEKLEAFTSNVAPYRLTFLRESSWGKWEGFDEQNPENETGGHSFDEENYFCTSALAVNSEDYSDEILANTMLSDFSLTLESDAFKLIKKHEGSPYRYLELKAQQKVDGDNQDYYFNIYFTPFAVFSIATWGPSSNENLESAHKELLTGLSFTPKKSLTNLNTLSPRLKKIQAEQFNNLGIALYNIKKYKEASQAYLTAFSLDSGLNYAATNYFWSQNNLNDYQSILNFIAKNPKTLESPKVLSWKAYANKSVGQNSQAIEDYSELFTKFKDYEDDNDFLDFIKLLAQENDFSLITEVSRNYLKEKTPVKTYYKYFDVLLDYEKYNQASTLLSELPEDLLNTVETKRKWLRYFIEVGQYKKADEAFTKLLNDGHRDKHTLYDGARLYYDIGWYRKAKSTLTELLKIAPEDEDGQKLMNYTLSYLGEGSKGQTTEEITPVPLPELLQKKISQDTELIKTKEDISYDYYLCSYSYENGKLKKTITRKFTLHTPKGVKDKSTLYYTYNPNSADIYVNTLKVTSKDGSNTVNSDRNAFYLTEADDDQATEDKTLCMPVSSLEPGCTVEYTLTESFNSSYSSFPFERYWLTLSVPYKLMALTITGETESIAAKMLNCDSKPVKTDNSLIFEAKNKLIYKSEPESVDSEFIYPLLILGDKSLNWQQESKDYFKKLQKKFIPSPVLTKLVTELTANSNNKEDKVQKLIAYIQNNITYKALEFGTRGIIPDSPEKVLKQKYGDCKDLSLLLHQMLKVCQIKSTLTLVDTDFKIHKDIADLDQFNHMILYIDDLDKFVDCTVKYGNLLTIGNRYMYDKAALLLHEKKASFKDIPYYPVNDKNIIVKRQIKLNDKNTLQVQEILTLKDYYAYFFRKKIHSYKASEIQEKLDGFLEYWPTVEALSYEFINLDDYQKEFSIKLNYQVKNAVQTLKDSTTVSLELPWLKYYMLTSDSPDRISPFKIYYGVNFSSQTTFKASPDIDIEYIPLNKSFQESFIDAQLQVSSEGQELSIDLSSDLKKGVYKASLYELYHKTCEDLMNSSLVHFKLKEK